MFSSIARWWCRNFHDQIYRPVRGQYRCAVCLRTWDVPWGEVTETAAPPTLTQQPQLGLQMAASPAPGRQ